MFSIILLHRLKSKIIPPKAFTCYERDKYLFDCQVT
jgi:hypothetical protein